MTKKKERNDLASLVDILVDAALGE